MGRNNAWLPEQSRLRTQYFPQRTQIMIDQFRAIGLFPALKRLRCSIKTAAASRRVFRFR